MDEWRIERLDRGHVREGFDCGKPSLNDFLQVLVSQYEKRNLGRLGIHAVVVDALDAAARTFHERFGFVPLTDDEMRLFLPMSTIRSAAKS